MYCVFYTLQIWNFNKLSLDFEERCPLHNASFFKFTNFGRDEVSFGMIVQNFVWLHLFFYFFFFFLVKIIKIHLAFQNTEYCKNYIILRKKRIPFAHRFMYWWWNTVVKPSRIQIICKYNTLKTVFKLEQLQFSKHWNIQTLSFKNYIALKLCW